MGYHLEQKIMEHRPRRQAEDPSARRLREEIQAVRLQIASTEELFNLSESEELTDACIYQLKALHLHLDYLLKEVRGEEPLPETAGLCPERIGGGIMG